MDSLSSLINDNDRFKKKPNNDNDIVKKLNLSEDEIDRVADWLDSELRGGDDSRGFYCKCARYFPRAFLTSIVSKAQNSSEVPNRLFCYLMKRELTKRGVK